MASPKAAPKAAPQSPEPKGKSKGKTKTRTELVQTKFGQLKVVVNDETGEIIPEKIELHRIPKEPAGADPEVEFASLRLGECNMTAEAIHKETIRIGRPVSVATILGLRFKQTKRPQNFTLTSIMMAIGFEKQWLKRTTPAS